MIADTDLEKQLRTILSDSISGSTALSLRIKELLSEISSTDLQPAIRRLLRAHGSMAAVINTINCHCLSLENPQSNYMPEDTCSSTLRKFWSHHGDKKRWITLSMSEWVIRLLLASPEKLNLTIGISYPHKEGMRSASRLSEGHLATVVEDNQLAAATAECDGIILGADLITDKYVTNKTGSFQLALAGEYFRKPLFIITSGDKFLSPGLLPLSREKIIKKGSQQIRIFERIPIQLISSIYLTSNRSSFPLSKTLSRMASF